MKTSFDYFGLHKVDINGFSNFCKKNIPLLIAVTIALFFTFGIKLFLYSIGKDTGVFFMDSDNYLANLTFSRWGLYLLHKSWYYLREFNPILPFFVAVCLIWLFTIFWCYIISIFSKNTDKNNKLIPFALLFMTSPVWAEQFYFTFQAAETSFTILLCPYIIYMLYKAFLENETRQLIFAFILLVFMISIYQAVLPLFCCGVFVCFLIFQENSDYEPQLYRNLCIKFFITILAAVTCYLVITKMIAVFIIRRNTYQVGKIFWGTMPIKKGIINILVHGYMITIGHIPVIRKIVEPIIAKSAQSGMQTAAFVSSMAQILGNIFLLPVAFLFITRIFAIIRKKIPSGRRITYFLAGISVPLSLLFLSILSGNFSPTRAQFVLPFAFAFMVFFLLNNYKKHVVTIITIMAVLISVYQTEVSAQLFYSDHLRYQDDLYLAMDLDRRIAPLQPEIEKLPIAFVGTHKIISHASDLSGQEIGRSLFESYDQRGIEFLYSLGKKYKAPDENQREQAKYIAESMPSYPSDGCVRLAQNMIVIKLSNDL
jgi:hypothetical protein